MEALVLFCNLAVETLDDKKKKAKKWLAAKHTVTPRAKAMFDKQVWGAAACTVRKSTDSIYLVDDLVRIMDQLDLYEGEFNARSAEVEEPQWRTFTVDLTSGTCTRCADRQQLQLPCRHIVAAVFSQNGKRTSTSGAFRFYHHAYTVAAYALAFQSAVIIFPFLPALLPDCNIRPPLRYNQAGGSSARTTRDVAAREKRIPSRGEQKASASTQKPTPKPKRQGGERAVIAAEMLEHFASEIRAEVKKKRKKITCSRCGKTEGHNAAKCPNQPEGNVVSDVQPGIYVAGSWPLELLQQRSAFVNSGVENPDIVSEYSF
ncbi:hypothetical protein PR003_g21907 [Phytophthora rubi]|uniref:SWIM-type domain-containing protein n=1 Tax=Phytophthora rubi TaxID=129364 RepID=A0A6A3JS56_9STRA|nr:hypothetical protein PR001_g19510 [Phytophthora rubi]KAE9303830.1 hypothetical protein PR003_g21907 [Phytophthora rubi]